MLAAAGCPRPAVNGRGQVLSCARTCSMREAGNIWIARVNVFKFTSQIHLGAGVPEGCVPARTDWRREFANALRLLNFTLRGFPAHTALQPPT